MIVPTWKRQGFESWNEYREHLAKEKGFESYSEYLEHCAKEKCNAMSVQTNMEIIVETL